MNFGMSAEGCEPLHQIIVDLFARCSLADDKGLMREVPKLDGQIAGARMVRREDGKYALGPELLADTASPFARTRDERDVQLMLPDGCQMLRRIAIDEGEFDRGMPLAESLDQIRQEARGQ